MSDEENYPRITITLPPDLAAWVKLKKDELDAKDRRMKTSVSAIIADAVADMKARDQANESGKASSPGHAGAKTLKLSKNFDTLSSRRGKVRSLKAG
jgi:hypothetical protein